tara:strand:+ start:143 stop:496 length:354 start_codon:yes stop_codon:yes gene_type:complete
MITYDLYCTGYNFLYNLGLGYGFAFTLKSWEHLTNAQKAKRIDEVYDVVKAEAELVTRWLDNKKIVLTGRTDEIGHHDYIDNRTPKEKELRPVKIARTKYNYMNFNRLCRVLKRLLS